MLLSLPLRWSCVARERMEFTNEVAIFPRQKCTCGHRMTCAQWTWNTRGLTICPIQDLLGINPTDDLRMHSKPSASWRCGGFLLVRRWSVLWIMCETPSMCEIPVWICADFVHRYFPMISGNPSQTSKTICSSYLDFFLFFLMCSEKSGCMVTMCVTLWLPARKQAHFLKSAYCYLSFLFLLYFVYETI